jgi:hypothetical protein
LATQAQSNQSESDRLYLEALLHITKGNQALADSTILSLEAEKSCYKEGTPEYAALDKALGEAKALQATAKSAAENMQLQFNVVERASLSGRP